MFGAISSLDSANQQLHIMSVPTNPDDKCDHTGEIGGKCCRVGDTECHYLLISGGQTQHGDYSGMTITGCTPPSGTNGHYTITGTQGGSVVTMQPAASAKCTDSAGNPFCSSSADAATLGPTYVYDATNGVCMNYCAAGEKCCQTTDQSGHSGCIGTDTGNQVKLNSCSLDDWLTSYTCDASGACKTQTTSCATTCKNAYSCN